MPRYQATAAARFAEGGRLAALRDVLGMSQRELADEFQVTSSAIAQWEAGQKTIPGPVLRLISLYERDLEVRTPKRSGNRLESTMDLGVLGATVMANGVFASAPASSIRARLRDRLFSKYVTTAGRSRGLSMKWAQMLWNVAPMLSDAQRAALREFESLGPIMTPAVATRVFLEEFGATPREAFAEWSPTPMASASLGQVHRATLKSGEQVAVKIQHPDAAAKMTADLEQLRMLERVALVFLRSQTPGVMHEEWRARFSEECDYRLEAKNQQRAREIYARDSDLFIPQVFDRWCSRRVITSAFVEGKSVEAFARTASRTDRDRAGAALWRFFGGAIVGSGVFHADPNPGNFLVQRDGRVACLDFGRVKRMSPEFHTHWKRIFRATLERNEDEVKRAIVDIGYLKDPAGFDFGPTLRLLWSWTWPSLVDGPFTFTPEYLKHAWDVYAADTTRASVDFHADTIFLPTIVFGVSGLLTTLRARVDCRAAVVPALYPNGGAPKPYSADELRRFGLSDSAPARGRFAR